jgi:Bifunctional DNA primase/polymerase, N-terminal
MSRIIPVTLNEFSMAEAFRFYRDELKLHVYPVDGHWSDKPDPGKKPSVKAWWNYDPKECDVAEFFKPQRCHNIGVCPTRGLIVLDLDSKPDEGKSVYEFLASRPNLAGIPRHRTRGGCHLVFFCDDLPEIKGPRGGPYEKPLVSQLSDAVTAELYHSNHSNIVFPPSTHPTMFKYEWDVTGEIPTIS